LFESSNENNQDPLIATSNVAERALSVATVENSFVEAVYDKISSIYGLLYGLTLHVGRLEAMRRLPIKSDDNILEVGVGSGINACLYPHDCSVTGIDFSSKMLKKAGKRIKTRDVRNVELLQMDGAALAFPDNTFDMVYAPYVISVVTDPVKVVREMHRVCRVGGHIVVLNHFKSENPILACVEKFISPLTVYIGFKADLDLPGFLVQSDLKPISIEKVNIPRMWSLITCRKEASKRLFSQE
jgi:phosphatidylethanolamine/phosphatidyl-N-methylethanolamine N-methyltransferase